MKRPTAQWVLKAEEDWQGAQALAQQKPPLRDLVCFHCQQTVEKYLKALLEKGKLPVPKTHDLEKLLELLLPDDAKLESLRRNLVSLSRFAVEYRYPGSAPQSGEWKQPFEMLIALARKFANA